MNTKMRDSVRHWTTRTVAMVASLAAATVLVTSQALAITPQAAAATPSFSIARLSGSDRFATAAAIARATYPSGTATVLLSTGTTFPDALAGNFLAGNLGAPILLTNPSGATPASTVSALAALHAKKVMILGGTAAVSAAQETALGHLGYQVSRISGSNRYQTMSMVAQYPGTTVGTDSAGVPTAILATGTSFPDALSAGPLSFAKKLPVILTDGSSATLSSVAATTLAKLHIGHVLSLGGSSAINPATGAALTKMGIEVSQLAGPNRSATSLAVAGQEVAKWGFSTSAFTVARGDDFADALAAGPAAGAQGEPLLITASPTDPGSVDIYAATHAVTLTNSNALGGSSALSGGLLSGIVQAVLSIVAPPASTTTPTTACTTAATTALGPISPSPTTATGLGSTSTTSTSTAPNTTTTTAPTSTSTLGSTTTSAPGSTTTTSAPTTTTTSAPTIKTMSAPTIKTAAASTTPCIDYPPPVHPTGSPYPNGGLGFDISWPQCPDMSIPTGTNNFDIIGVNDGHAYSINPCLQAQAAWAGSGLSLVMNLNVPVPSFDNNETNHLMQGPVAACAATGQLGCQYYDYGYNAAISSMADTALDGVSSNVTWWLDIEAPDSQLWSTNTAANSQVIRGAIAALNAAGHYVGIYSTAYQWGLIAGNYAPGAALWVATGSDPANLAYWCGPSHEFGGGTTWLVQFGRGSFDGDYSC